MEVWILLKNIWQSFMTDEGEDTTTALLAANFSRVQQYKNGDK